MANNTGIVMEDEETAQENVADATTEAAVEETTETVQGNDASSANDAEGENPTNAASGDPAAGAQPEPTATDSSPEVKENEKTYSQEYVDQLNAKHERDQQFSEKRIRDVEAELKEKKEKIDSIHKGIRDRESNTDSMFLLLGDGSPAKIFALVKKAVDLQLEANKVGKLQKDYDDLLKAKKTIDTWYTDLNQKYLALKTESDADKVELAQKSKDLQEAQEANQELYAQYEAGETMRDRVLKSSAPQCLIGKEWFDAFSKDLRAELQKDPIFDPATLVFASLAELAVMERSPTGACFEWKKQLSDVGLVVANYMHQKKTAEGDVFKMLHNFAQALQEMPILKKLKIVFKLPALGGDFNTDEVKHKNNGSSVAKILNWCIIEDGHVYSKAIVE